MPTEMENYLFDLNGYLILENAITQEHVTELNAIVDDLGDMEPGDWRGRVNVRPGDKHSNRRMRCIYEAGEPFERLIDHSSWIDHIRCYVGSTDGLTLQQSWVMLREKGPGGGLHSGAHKRRIRTQFRYHDGFFRCGEVNILLALRELNPEDGPTMVIPGSHKSNIIHPSYAAGKKQLDEIEGAVLAPLKAGDALLFVDCLAHGSGPKTTDELRRICVYRYGPKWGRNPYGYEPSPDLLGRLTPERRKIVQPAAPRLPPEELERRGLPLEFEDAG